MDRQEISSAHQTFPLSSFALNRLSLTPEFDYPDLRNARELNGRLRPPLPAYTPGEIAAVGLIGKIYLRVIELYLVSSPISYHTLDALVLAEFGPAAADKTIRNILSHFPTSRYHYSPEKTTEYLLSFSGSPENRHGLYESFLLIFLADSNQALREKDNLFTDASLRLSPQFGSLRSLFFSFFSDPSEVSPGGKSLIDFLTEPARLHPASIFDQLEFIREHWKSLLGEVYLSSLLRALDFIKEEKTPGFFGKAVSANPLGYSQASYLADPDQVRFSDDLDWMPRVILMAKNVFVWLDQLSKEYQESINRLDLIPDQELAKLSGWGITGLWLIGLWQRSSASQKIKQICGNLDAVPSAYSLYDYSIAESLGGEDAYQDLSQRAARFNIRLAADMVPNHMGIYSKWVVEHPDWFLSIDHSPFPGYSFQGADLSEDPRTGIYIEDHYYDKTDAAVVFKRLDRQTGTEVFIYHGNDGTSMPWNDTAQLNFLNPEVKEAVIQNILHVARKFPIIRFDAAMTLAKKHIQRLWFPEPGSGGAIPTRSEYGLSKKDFDKLMPEEFWREVVDRVATEAPDTLLLAEAFWMMEGYFVRSLGMHRVYNSAFMHMLRDEDNAKYRDLIKNTLIYDAQILKRYVNFMNNPDEESASAQFGSDGKYFGVCVLLATLPGLPMFGHGQVEGYLEKYGMEYQRAYYDEQPNKDLIDRHHREIFPLLHKRYLFAEVDHFTLFDFKLQNGKINEDVFAFTNRSGKESVLVVYHNKWGETIGNIHSSTPIHDSSTRLIDSLGLPEIKGDYILYRDQITGLEYIRDLIDFSTEGLPLFLRAYEYFVFMDFKIVSDLDGSYSLVSDMLDGKGVPSLNDARIEIKLAPLASALDSIISSLSTIIQAVDNPLDDLGKQLTPLLNQLNTVILHTGAASADLEPDIVIKCLFDLERTFPLLFPGNYAAIKITSILWCLLSAVYTSATFAEIDNLHRVLARQPYLGSAFSADLFSSVHKLLKLNISLAPILDNPEFTLPQLVDIWFDPDIGGSFLEINTFNEATWFNKESFEQLLDLTIADFLVSAPIDNSIGDKMSGLDPLIKFRKSVLEILAESNFQVAEFRISFTKFMEEWNSQEVN